MGLASKRRPSAWPGASKKVGRQMDGVSKMPGEQLSGLDANMTGDKGCLVERTKVSKKKTEGEGVYWVGKRVGSGARPTK